MNTKRRHPGHRGGVNGLLWGALRICRHARTGDIPTLTDLLTQPQRKNSSKYFCALRRAGIVGRHLCSGKASWELVRDLGPQVPTYRRRAGVLYDHNTGAGVALWKQQKKPIG